VYFVKEKFLTYLVHLHISRNIPKTKFAVGLGYEQIFDNHKHTTFGYVGTYRPIYRLSFNSTPELTFER
jgi:hypothetical protein